MKMNTNAETTFISAGWLWIDRLPFFFHASFEFGHVSCVLLALIFALNSIIKFYGFPRKSTLVKLYCTFVRLLTHSHFDLVFALNNIFILHCICIQPGLWPFKTILVVILTNEKWLHQLNDSQKSRNFNESHGNVPSQQPKKSASKSSKICPCPWLKCKIRINNVWQWIIIVLFLCFPPLVCQLHVEISAI